MFTQPHIITSTYIRLWRKTEHTQTNQLRLDFLIAVLCFLLENLIENARGVEAAEFVSTFEFIVQKQVEL